MIDLMPNATFFVQLGIFLFTLTCMHLLIFRPVLRLMAKRKEVTEGYRHRAEDLDSQTEQMVAHYEAKLKSAREEGLALKGKLTKEGEEAARALLDQARQGVEQELAKNRQALQAEAKEAQLTLRKYSRQLSVAIAEKLLGRKVSA
jgi:F-type H+-transporting ATPase subunit b